MKNNNTASTPVDNGGLGHWNSPLPYLFVGLALMLGLIAMALMLLACSYPKSPPSNHSDEKSYDDRNRLGFEMEMEPKIVVIMAGDHNPTYLAKPAAVT
ncbi:protein GLUTAMINE DUMPER 5-like [Mercurialis annua]|uniref:protein GLUTAMINE DUMPER 5-like n=1 Tax=Mercurialis annua TaxID=3986 RepID=UPI00215E9A51|nr:protein GLUTAMINE DUMPER 5-like [Mercurialis annua]